jgi:hypothetical protein
VFGVLLVEEAEAPAQKRRSPPTFRSPGFDGGTLSCARRIVKPLIGN